MQVDVRFNAVDSADFGDVISRQLIAAAWTQLEDRAVGLADKFGDNGF